MAMLVSREAIHGCLPIMHILLSMSHNAFLVEHLDQICGDIIKQLAAVIIKEDKQDGNAGKSGKCKEVRMAVRTIALHSGQYPFELPLV